MLIFSSREMEIFSSVKENKSTLNNFFKCIEYAVWEKLNCFVCNNQPANGFHFS